jgi:hypothetical protein
VKEEITKTKDKIADMQARLRELSVRKPSWKMRDCGHLRKERMTEEEFAHLSAQWDKKSRSALSPHRKGGRP